MLKQKILERKIIKVQMVTKETAQVVLSTETQQKNKKD